MNPQDILGFLLINKPVGITSYDCIRHVKKIVIEKIKIGHAGTLDPFASGLMILALGRDATRIISRCSNLDKTYTATGKLGIATSTQDKTGQIIKECNVEKLPLCELTRIVLGFKGEYAQTPPIYSALKHEGMPLYKLARKEKRTTEELEKIAERKTKTVTIHEIELLNYDHPFFTLKTRVSKGTYIRSLVHDIGKRALCPATTYELSRDAIGPFELQNAADLEQIASIDDIANLLISPEKVIELISN